MDYCKASPADRSAFCALWQAVFGDDEAFAGMVFDRFAGPQRVFAAKGEDGRLAAALCTVPVSLQNRPGAYFYGLATDAALRGRGIMSGLIEHACTGLAREGAAFAVLVPAGPELFGFYEKRGFVRAFGRRVVSRSVRHNLWAQAEFDTVTAKHWLALRAQYCPKSVALTPAGAVAVLTDLYSSGATIVSSEDAYGIYFAKGDTMRFLELFAEGDRAAERLIEAARERERAERAVLTLGAAQNLFVGEGEARDYGMVRFLGQPFDLAECYMGNMLDEQP